MSHQASVARLVHNTGFSLGANILAHQAHVVLLILISRLAGPADAGILTIGITYMTIARRLSSWGLGQILVRDVAQDLSRGSKYLVNFLLLRVLLSLGLYLGLGGFFLFVQPYRLEVVWLVYLISLNMLPESILDLCDAVFIAHERLEFVTLNGALVGSLKLLFGVGALLLGFGVTGAVVGLLVANLGAMIGVLAFVFWRYIPWRWAIDLKFCWTQSKIATPFVLMTGAFIIDLQLDTLLLSWQVQEDQVGLYGAAISLISTIQALPEAYRNAIFPRLARAFFVGPDLLHPLYRQSYKYLLLIAVPVTFGLATLAEPILTWIFGARFVPAATVLQLLAVSVGLRFLVILHNRLLIAANYQSQLARFLVVGLLLNAILNLGLVPVLGINGAAAARLASNLVVFGLTYYAVFNQIYAYDARNVWGRPFIAGVLMVVVVWLLEAWPVWLRIPSGAATYGGVLLMLGTFSQNEIITWLQILKLGRLANRFSG